MIYNEKSRELINVNNNGKVIVYSKASGTVKKDTLMPTQQQMFQIDSAIFSNCAAKYIEKNELVTCIELSPKKDSQYTSIRIIYDSKTLFFRKIEFYPKKMEGVDPYEKIEVAYLNFSSSPNTGDEYFSAKKFVVIDGEKVSLKPVYKNYKLINQTKPLVKAKK